MVELIVLLSHPLPCHGVTNAAAYTVLCTCFRESVQAGTPWAPVFSHFVPSGSFSPPSFLLGRDKDADTLLCTCFPEFVHAFAPFFPFAPFLSSDPFSPSFFFISPQDPDTSLCTCFPGFVQAGVVCLKMDLPSKVSGKTQEKRWNREGRRDLEGVTSGLKSRWDYERRRIKMREINYLRTFVQRRLA